MLEDIFRRLFFLEMGIVPISRPWESVVEELKTLAPDDERVARRKFRKRWRKLLKRATCAQQRRCTSSQPSHIVLYNRKLLVRDYVEGHVIKLKQKFNEHTEKCDS